MSVNVFLDVFLFLFYVFVFIGLCLVNEFLGFVGVGR